MLASGVIDETGRIAAPGEVSGLSGDMESRLVDVDGSRAFLLVKEDQCDCGSDITITQRDIRELQNAKAAIAAGIKTLVKAAGISMEDIDRVCLAGGFGSFINAGNALTIGLIPQELKGKIQSIGNAAGAGAVEGLLSSRILKCAEKVSDRIKYIELSTDKGFSDEYIECMMFEE